MLYRLDPLIHNLICFFVILWNKDVDLLCGGLDLLSKSINFVVK